MRAVSRLCLPLGLLAGFSTLNAQEPVWVAPGVSFDGTDPALDFTANPVLQGLTPNARPIYGVSLHKMPSDPAGTWTVCMTIRQLQGFNNPGFTGFILAKWTPGDPTPLVLTHEADAMNDAFVDYTFNLEPITRDPQGQPVGGRYAVFDRFVLGPNRELIHQGVFLAARADDTSPFGTPVQVAGVVGTRDFADPALGYVDGQLKLFYGAEVPDASGAPVRGIVMDDLLDVTTSPRVAGQPRLVAQPVDTIGVPPAYCHSPTPLTGPDGDVEGLFLAEGDGDGNIGSIYFAADLDPATPHVETFASINASWLNSGGAAGGTMLFSDPVNQNTPRLGHGAWLLGDEVAPGEAADVRVFAYSPPGAAPACTAVFVSHQWLPHPVSLGFAFGLLAMPPMAVVAGGAVPDADQVASYRIPIPARVASHGADIAIQALTTWSMGRGRAVATLTNSATIRVR